MRKGSETGLTRVGSHTESSISITPMNGDITKEECTLNPHSGLNTEPLTPEDVK